MKFGISSQNIWRQRVVGSFLALPVLLTLYLIDLLPLHGPQLLVVFLALPASYLVALFAQDSRSPIAWPIYLCEGSVLAFLIQLTGGVASPFVVLAYPWMFGAALTFIRDGFRPLIIPILALFTALVLVTGTWGNDGFVFYAVVNIMSLVCMAAAFMVVSMERRAARVDTLLPMVLNRNAGIERLEDWLKTNKNFQLSFIDLATFKTINDTLGHRAGDDVLRAVAQRLRSAVRSEDIVFRYGGDEFIVATQNPLPRARLEDLFARPVETAAGPIQVGIDIGQVVGEPHGDLDKLLCEADALMYSQKRSRQQRLLGAAPSKLSANHPYGQELN